MLAPPAQCPPPDLGHDQPAHFSSQACRPGAFSDLGATKEARTNELNMRMNRSIAVLLALASAFPAVAQDAAAGQRQFAGRCAACHSATPGAKPGMGPNLARLMGQKSGTRAGFSETSAIRQAAIVWTSASLDAFLAAPIRRVPGSRMVTAVPDRIVRANIVAYFASIK